MWFPYSLPTSWKVEGDRESAHDSRADDQEREFLVGIQLRNPVSREWSVELQLKQSRWETHRDHTGAAVHVGYFPDENGRLSEITCKIADRNPRQAVDRSFELVSDMLSYWSALYGRGFSIGGLRIADLRHNARWRVLPHWPSAQKLEPAAGVRAVPDSLLAVASLYREGRTSTSDRYRFLCCEAILGKWNRGEAPFDQVFHPDSVAGQGPGRPVRGHHVTEELLVISGMHSISPDLEGVEFSNLSERLREWHAIAADYVLKGDVGEGWRQGLQHASQWAAVANLVDLVAHHILSEAIEYYADNARHGQAGEVYAGANTG